MTKLEWNDLLTAVEKCLLASVPGDLKLTVGLMISSRLETLAQDVNTVAQAYHKGWHQANREINTSTKDWQPESKGTKP